MEIFLMIIQIIKSLMTKYRTLMIIRYQNKPQETYIHKYHIKFFTKYQFKITQPIQNHTIYHYYLYLIVYFQVLNLNA